MLNEAISLFVMTFFVINDIPKDSIISMKTEYDIISFLFIGLRDVYDSV